MGKIVLLVGYGSIGKRHARNLVSLGIRPYVLTNHPDKARVKFLKGLSELRGRKIGHCIIASPTARHLEDLKMCSSYLSLYEVLIEKPLESTYSKSAAVRDIARKYGIHILVGYNLRFINAFDAIARFIKRNRSKIRIVEAVAGQDLMEWRPYRKVSSSYSAERMSGGGVDLDLSHEVDYILWLFGTNFDKKLIYSSKISALKINSPDIFKLVLGFKSFIVDITLDYIRKPKERFLKITCEGGGSLHYDFITRDLKIYNKSVLRGDHVNISYKKMLKAFLGRDKIAASKLCSIEEGLRVLKVLEV